MLKSSSSPTTSFSSELRRFLEEALIRGLTLRPENLPTPPQPSPLFSSTSPPGPCPDQAKPQPPPLTFRDFVAMVKPRYRWYRHCEVLAQVLQRVADGELRRVMVFMPPRHGKSEEVSRLFSAYWLYRFPHQWVGICSYGAELAHTLSRAARQNYREAGGSIDELASAVKHWETGKGGGMWAAGVGGPITGKGWNLGIIDDPLKNAQEAASSVTRNAQREWYGSTFYTREEPNAEGQPDGALIVIQTRWNEDDLAGWMLKEESEDEEAEHWHIVSLEAIKEEEPPAIPATCTLEPDWRQPGEALCPERRPVEKLNRIARRIGSYFWNALFQQRPRPAEGKLFKRSWFPIISPAEVPAIVDFVRRWDFAGTLAEPGKDPDYTADCLMGKTSDADGPVFVIFEVRRVQLSPAGVERRFVDTAHADRKRFFGRSRIRGEQEPGSAGKYVGHHFTSKLAGFDVRFEPSTGSKVERARPLASQAEIGNVKLVKAPWNEPFLDELVAFPTAGVHDDQVDVAAGALQDLTEYFVDSVGAW